MPFVVVILLIAIVIFGATSMSQSYATAQQAQAQIETARVAQISAAGNLVTILTLTLVIVVAVAIIAAVVFWMIKRSSQRSARAGQGGMPRVSAGNPPQIDPLDQLTRLATLKLLMSMTSKPGDQPETLSLQAPKEEPVDDLFQWLR
jgi:uncharacterized protein HemY